MVDEVSKWLLSKAKPTATHAMAADPVMRWNRGRIKNKAAVNISPLATFSQVSIMETVINKLKINGYPGGKCCAGGMPGKWMFV